MDDLSTDESGLSSEEARRRRETHGPNELQREESVSPLALFVEQFRDPLIYLLVFAAVLSLAVGLLPGEEPAYVDAALIGLILLGNGVFGFVQDYRAEQAMERLREMATPEATVMRDGHLAAVDATEVVPGDVVVVEGGDVVPADARLLDGANVETAEATLTGESTPVSKSPAELPADTPLAERTNMLYMNTTVVKGRGRAVVVETGMSTAVGGIATQLQRTEETETPFQREVHRLGRRIGYGVVGLILLLVVVQAVLTRAAPVTILLTALTLAVAAVPEGLPAVVTLTLALGSQRLMERNALVRRLPVVESLGSVDVILTDKTGTLTESRMTVTRIVTDGETFEVTGSGLETAGEFRGGDGPTDPERLAPILRCGAVCNNAELPRDDTRERAGTESAGSQNAASVDADTAESVDTDTAESVEADNAASVEAADREERAVGDPTEVALLVSAAKAGIDGDADRLAEIPFSSERGRMTVVVDEGEPTAYTKGAPEVVVERCDSILDGGEVVPLTDERRAEVLRTNEALAGDALRVLAFARRVGVDPDGDPEAVESGLTLLGLQGMLDPPRPEVPGAVADCRDAGIRVVMATGDNVVTARAIGEEIGFDPEGALTGSEVAALSDEELREVVREVEVFARMAPEHKVRVLEALQAAGNVVAMTGDGVNDAPGVRRADVGIAMGVRGTDVTRDASDMVLLDDNFATIRDAIAEGRAIFDNIQKFVNLLLSANTGEVLTVFVGVLVGSVLFPDLFASQAEALVLTPVMLLWINLVTDGPPALALGVDPQADDVLERDPRDAGESVIDRHVVISVATIGVTVTAAGLAVFFDTLRSTGSLVAAQTLLFTFFVVAEMGLIQVIRRRFAQPLLSNRWLLAAVAVSLLTQLAVLYTPVAGAFGVVPPSLDEWSGIGAAVGLVLVANLLAGVLYERLLE